MAENLASAAPEVDAPPARARSASSSLAGAPAEPHHPRGQPHDQPLEIARAASLQHVDALGDLQRIAHGAAERRVHVGDERLGPDAVRGADRDQRARQRARVVDRLHEGAAAALHVEDQRVAALGDLLAHHRRRDQRDALDRRGHVAQRVQRLVRGRDVPGLADQAAADVARAWRGTRRSTARCGIRGSLRACRACRRCGPRPRPDIFGTTTPHAATSGASTIDTLSPTPPVLCLPTLMPGSDERSTRRPERTIASVSQAVSSAVMPRRTMAMSSAETW